MDTTTNGFRRINKEEAKALVRKAHAQDKLEMRHYFGIKKDLVETMPGNGRNAIAHCGSVACVCGTIVIEAGGVPASVGTLPLTHDENRYYFTNLVIAPNGKKIDWQEAGIEVLGITESNDAYRLFSGRWGLDVCATTEDRDNARKMMAMDIQPDLDLTLRAMEYFIR